MSGPFFEALLAKASLDDLLTLFQQEQPSTDTLIFLVNKLQEQQAFDQLELLLSILGTNPLYHALEIQINNLLFMNALHQADSSRIKKTLQALNLLIADEKATWTITLSEVIQWLNTTAAMDTFDLVLESLPVLPREMLYNRLFEIVQGKPLWVESAIRYILSTSTKHSFDSPIQLHLQNLAITLLLSPTRGIDSQLTKLSLLLNTDQLVNLTFQLRATAATYSSDKTHTENARFAAQKQIYLSHFESLVTALAVRATSSLADYQNLIHGNPELANLLMTKYLKTFTQPEKQLELIHRILDNCSQFNWDDLPFHQLVVERLLFVFATLPLEQLRALFKAYYQQPIQKSSNAIIQLLDRYFDQSRDSNTILRLIQDNDTEDKILTINFITASKARRPELAEQLLQRLDELQLIKLCGHILALKQMEQYESEPLSLIYCSVLCHKIKNHAQPAILLQEWIMAILELPENSQDEPIAALFNHLNSQPSLMLVGVKALMTATGHAQKLFPYCQQILRLISAPDQAALLKTFSKEDLLEFYLFLGKNNANLTDFNCFIELFKEIEWQPVLLYFLISLPLSDQAFIDCLIPLLEDKSIITLIDLLIDKIKLDSSYTLTLEQLLIYLCAQLQLHPNESHPLHRWVDCENHQEIAQQLLRNPVCFYSLASRSSQLQYYTPSLLQGLLVSKARDDLLLRMARVLNCISNNLDANNIVLGLLSHFSHSPKILQTIFVNLEQIQSVLNEQGQKNYQRLIKASWDLLQTNAADAYDEKSCIQLLTTELTSPHRFDSVFAKLASNLSEKDEGFQSAHFLTQIEPSAFDLIRADTLVTILLKSIQKETVENWQKVTSFLNNKTFEFTAPFISILINKITTSAHSPQLTERAVQFILKLDHFEAVLPFLNEEEVLWIIRECPSDFLITHFPDWLDILLENHRLDSLNPAALFLLLPMKQAFLEELYQRPGLVPYLHGLFFQLVEFEHCTKHFIALFQQLCKQSDEERRRFINLTLEKVQPQKIATTAASVLNMLLLSLPQLKVSSRDDRELINQQFRFLTQAALKSSLDPTQLSSHLHSLQQLLFNTLKALISQDSAWAAVFLNSLTFSQTTEFWLSDIDEKSSHSHPFTAILLENAHLSLHPTLVNSTAYQTYIKYLLSNPSAQMTDDQFSLLFFSLSLDNQKKLALELLERPVLDAVQWSSLVTLSRALPPESLFAIYERSKTRFIFIDLLFRHPEGIKKLSTEQKNNLLENLNSAKQVLRILDSQTPIATKYAFVTALFTFLKHKNIPLESWLLSMHFDEQTLAALLNFTVQPADQQLLRQLLEKNNHRMRAVQHYLQNPVPDMMINAESSLYQLLKQAWLNPWQGGSCHPSLLKFLDPLPAKFALKNQLQFLTQLQQFSRFLEPFSTLQESAAEVLIAGRWIQRLSLLHDAFLEITLEYQQSSDKNTIAAIKKTQLYSSLIEPFLSGLSIENLAPIIVNDLVALLDEYLAALAAVNPVHKKRVQAAYQQFLQTLALIENHSYPRLFAFFNPHSYIGRIKNNRISAMQNGEAFVLCNSALHHQQKLQSNNYAIHEQVNALLSSLLKYPELLQDEDIHRWLTLLFFLPMPIGNINPSLLKALIAAIPTREFIHSLGKMQITIQSYQEAFTQLKVLADQSSMTEALTLLWDLPPAKLEVYIRAMQSAQLPQLSSLLTLISRAHEQGLSKERIETLLLPKDLGSPFDYDWIHAEVRLLEDRYQQLRYRCTELRINALRYRGDANDRIRLTNLSSVLKNKAPDGLVECLSSYSVLFEKPNDPLIVVLLETMEQLFNDPAVAPEILSRLPDSFVKQTIQFALKNPLQHEKLIEQLIQAGAKEPCKILITQALQECLTIPENDSPPSMMQISYSHLNSLSLQEPYKVMILQRLFFQIEPQAELQQWQINGSEMNSYNRALFCADASMFNCLMQLQQLLPREETDNTAKIQNWLERCFSYLRQKSHVGSYFLAGRALNHQQPAIYFYFLSLLAFLSEDSGSLIDQFLAWVNALPAEGLAEQPYLKKFLNLLVKQNLLIPLCHRLQEPPRLNETKLNWMFENIISIQAIDNSLIETIIGACPWSWIAEQIKSSAHQGLLFLSQSLKKTGHCEAILQNNQSIIAFFQLLSDCKFSVNALLDLLNDIDHRGLRSLIMIHILSRMDYLQNIEGDSFLLQLNDADHRLQLRLKPLIHPIDLQQLPLELIQQLPPEAAASLFCSVKHFHLFSKEHITILLQRVGIQRDILINYWLNYYASMPNGFMPLMTLVEQFPNQVLAALSQMSYGFNQPILLSLIKQISQLPSLSTTYLSEFAKLCDASHLNQAIQLYLHGPKDKVELKAVITELVKTLVGTQQLSSETIQQLVRLSEEDNFQELQDYIGKATGDYLKSSALFEDCSIFYDDGRINIKRMLKVIPVIVNELPGEKKTGFFNTFFQGWKKVLPKSSAEPVEPVEPPLPIEKTAEDLLIDKLIQRYDDIRAFNYFLIYYKGGPESLRRCLEDYLNYFEFNNPSIDKMKQLYASCWLMNQKEIPLAVRTTLFQCVFNHPKLFKSKIILHLLIFNADLVLKHLGRNKEYERLIALGTDVLPLLKAYPEVQTKVQQAIKEAEFESSLAKLTGYFINFRIWLKRSWHYGWGSWFSPNEPQFVAYFNNDAVIIPHTTTTKIIKLVNKRPEFLEKLDTLLKQIHKESALADIQIFHDALIIYEWELHDENEKTIRQAVDAIFQSLINRAQLEGEIRSWLINHTEPFIKNRELLIGLYCQSGEKERLETLLDLANAGPGSFGAIAEALKEAAQIERLKIAENPSVVEEVKPESPSFIEGVTQTLGAMASYLPFWKKESEVPIPEPGLPSANKGWFSGWFTH